jgi:hypothetical protein
MESFEEDSKYSQATAVICSYLQASANLNVMADI